MRIVGTQPEGLIIVPDLNTGMLEGQDYLRPWERQRIGCASYRHAMGKIGLLHIADQEDIWPIFCGENPELLKKYVVRDPDTTYNTLVNSRVTILDMPAPADIHKGFREIRDVTLPPIR